MRIFYRAPDNIEHVLHVTQIKFRSRIGWTRLMPNKWIMEIRVLKNETCSFIYSFDPNNTASRHVRYHGSEKKLLD